ncbi:MAG: hypothetical protein J2P49_00005 [Methylocapsa sp.]|nr:hypothetical protein [Methylocapsa sp.]
MSLQSETVLPQNAEIGVVETLTTFFSTSTAISEFAEAVAEILASPVAKSHLNARNRRNYG